MWHELKFWENAFNKGADNVDGATEGGDDVEGANDTEGSNEGMDAGLDNGSVTNERRNDGEDTDVVSGCVTPRSMPGSSDS